MWLMYVLCSAMKTNAEQKKSPNGPNSENRQLHGNILPPAGE